MVARTEGGGDLSPGPAGTDRHAVPERLRHRHHVGLEALRLEGEPVSGPAETRLDLVEHQQRVALGAQRAHGTEVVRARHHDPALALQRLEQHRGHRLGVERLVERGDVVVRHVHEALGQRQEGRLFLGLAGRSQGGERPAVKGVVHADDDVATAPSPAPGQLERAFVRLRPRVGEEDLASGLPRPAVDQPVDRAGHLGRERVAVEVGHVAQRPRLLGHGLGDHGVGVAERDDREPRDEVEVLGAVGVEEHRALAAHERHRRIGVGAHEHLALAPFAGAVARAIARAVARHGSTIVPTPNR